MIKRRISMILAVVLLLGCMVMPVSAATANSKASLYLSTYRALISGASGKLEIGYTVGSGSIMTSIGVSEIKIYKSNGSLMTTVTGTTKNGLLVSNTDFHSDVYTYYGAVGTSYYAVVTVIASCSGGSDTRTITTKTVTITR